MAASQNRCLIVSSNNKDVCWEKLSALLSTPVADPEFPGSALTYYLVKFLPRAAWKWKNLSRGISSTPSRIRHWIRFCDDGKKYQNKFKNYEESRLNAIGPDKYIYSSRDYAFCSMKIQSFWKKCVVATRIAFCGVVSRQFSWL